MSTPASRASFAFGLSAAFNPNVSAGSICFRRNVLPLVKRNGSEYFFCEFEEVFVSHFSPLPVTLSAFQPNRVCSTLVDNSPSKNGLEIKRKVNVVAEPICCGSSKEFIVAWE